MAARALPASSAEPPAKLCDASGMAEIHRMFRSGFAEAPAFVQGVAAGDTAHAAAVATHLDLLSASLHGHHEGEDQRLWSMLSERSPACGSHVTRMQEQHAQMLVHLQALDAAVPAWRASAQADDRIAVLEALAGVNEALAVHLPDEERTIVPVMETVITEEEVQWFAEHGRKHTPKGQTWNSLGAILRAQPDGGEAWQRKHLPAPVRLMWRAVGARRYAKSRAVLEGR